MNSNTAILVFVNSAQEELLHKPISGGEKLFNELTQRTIAITRNSGLPFFIYTEKNQIGDTFAERFVNAIQTTYDLGFENVITIGNDTPHLTKKHLLESVTHLQNNKFVLGPSADGGFYLMGLHKSQFNPSTFLKLPWQSKDLAKNVSLLIKTAKIQVEQLEVLYDIDTVDDLKIITKLSYHISKTLKSTIDKISNSCKVLLRHVLFIIDQFFLQYFYNKGSPRSIALHSSAL